MSARDGLALFVVSDRERYGRHAIGASVLQTPGGIQSELSKIDKEIRETGAEIEAAVKARGGRVVEKAEFLTDMLKKIAAGGTPTPVTSSSDPLVQFYSTTWLPFANGWSSWYHDHDGWFHNLWWNEAPNGEAYQRKLVQLRASAAALGTKIASPAPDIEGPSIADPHRQSPVDWAAGGVEAVAKIVKYALYAALGLGVVYVGTEIARGGRGRK